MGRVFIACPWSWGTVHVMRSLHLHSTSANARVPWNGHTTATTNCPSRTGKGQPLEVAQPRNGGQSEGMEHGDGVDALHLHSSFPSPNRNLSPPAVALGCMSTSRRACVPENIHFTEYSWPAVGLSSMFDGHDTRRIRKLYESRGSYTGWQPYNPTQALRRRDTILLQVVLERAFAGWQPVNERNALFDVCTCRASSYAHEWRARCPHRVSDGLVRSVS